MNLGSFSVFNNTINILVLVSEILLGTGCSQKISGT